MFQKILLPLEKQALCVSDFWLGLREKTTNSRFHNFDFQELSNKLSFRTEQSMSTTKPLRKLAINFFRFFEEKSAFLSSRLAVFTFAWIFSPLGDPRFRLSAFESTFPWKWDTVLQNTNLPSNGHENAAFCVLFPAVGARSNTQHDSMCSQQTVHARNPVMSNMARPELLCTKHRATQSIHTDKISVLCDVEEREENLDVEEIEKERERGSNLRRAAPLFFYFFNV